MSSDPIVAEIHAIRERLAARFNYDVRAIGKDAQERQALVGHKVVCLRLAAPRAGESP